MWPLISPASGAPVSFIFDLIRLWPVFHISGVPPSSATRSNKLWLAFTSAMIVAPGSSLQHGPGEDHQQLVAPDHAALAVDRADAVAVAVEGDAEVELLARNERLEVGEILLDGRIGVVVGESAVDLAEDDVMMAGKLLDQHVQDRTCSAVPGVPADAEGFAGESLQQAVDIGFADVDLLDAPVALGPVAGGSAPAERLDLLPEHRTAFEQHLEAVVIGRVVAPGHLDAAFDVEIMRSEIEHRARAPCRSASRRCRLR